MLPLLRLIDYYDGRSTREVECLSKTKDAEVILTEGGWKLCESAEFNVVMDDCFIPQAQGETPDKAEFSSEGRVAATRRGMNVEGSCWGRREAP